MYKKWSQRGIRSLISIFVSAMMVMNVAEPAKAVPAPQPALTQSEKNPLQDQSTALLSKKTSVSVKLSQGKAKTKITLKMNDKLLAKSSSVYQHSLAQFLSGISDLMYDSSHKNLKSVMKKMGYKDISFTKDTTGTTASYMLAHKSTKIKNAKQTILMVVIRGTETAEWMDNFNSGYGKETHEGFQNAANALYEGISDYIEENQLGDYPVKMIITGHSRGGAVANLLGKKLDDSIPSTNTPTGSGDTTGLSAVTLTKKSIFVYTFAAPNTTKSSERESEGYDNILNIVNRDDMVAKLLPEQWGYGRYGVTYILPENVSKKLSKFYKKVTGKKYSYKKSYGKKITQYLTDVTKEITSNEEYYTKNLKTKEITSENESHSLKKMYEQLFTASMGEDRSSIVILSAEIALGQWGEIGIETMGLFADEGFLEALTVTHGPDTYFAKLHAYSQSQISEV